MKENLVELLQIKKGMTSIIGGGGKTTLMLVLAQELAKQGKVLVTTSTKILQPQICETLLDPTADEIREVLTQKQMLCVASLHASGKLCAPSIGFAKLSELADYVLVEADGSKHLPLKAHASFEPVIPKETNNTICVIGIDGLGKKISEACHRPKIFAKLVGTTEDDLITPDFLAKAIRKEALAQRFFINKIATSDEWKLAQEIAALLDKPVVAGSLWKGEYRCLL
ncbi:MAG: selenium cofactor biosynthesis protein YqeC [Phascolarctobacterium sp.]|nr:selenium cofactor biosynthesis protein YqeC [Phascolarctobacterium sp.]